MSIQKVFGAALACLAVGTSLTWAQGTCGTWTTSKIQNCDGYDYELWNQNNRGTVSQKITGGQSNPNGGTFEATWSGTENILTRAGKKWGSGSTTTPKTAGNITIDFEATWSSGDNVKMMGVYGWAYYPQANIPSGFTNQIEYYIIQDRGSYNPASGGTNSKKFGSGTIDGIVYDFYTADRINQPDLSGQNGTFKQYFSVPQSTSSHRQKGMISVSKHYEAWEAAGMKFMDCRLYEVAMKIESYTGSANGNGSAKVSKNLLTFGPPPSNDYTLTATASPSSGGTVTKSPNTTTYLPNTSVQLTATPNTGWKFVGWAGDATGTTSPTTVTMTKSLSVTAKFELVSGESTDNLIKDGNFPTSAVIADDGASWKLAQGTNLGNSAATATVSGGIATIDVTAIGTEAYQPQLVQYDLGLDKGLNYKLTFKAKAAAARKIAVAFQQSVDPWADYATKEFDLTTTEQSYEFVFTMTSDSDPASQFAFNLGQVTGAVSISDVKLVLTSSGPTSVIATRGGAPLFSVKGRTLNVLPVDGSNLQVRVVDIKGKVVANFNAANAATFSLENMPAGLYILDVTGTSVKQSTPFVLK